MRYPSLKSILAKYKPNPGSKTKHVSRSRVLVASSLITCICVSVMPAHAVVYDVSGIPTKNTGDAFTAAELNLMIDMIRNLKKDDRDDADITNDRFGFGLVGNPTSMVDVNGTVTATAFDGDGSALTNLPNPGLWSPTASDIYFNGGKVAIGINSSPTDELEVHATNTTILSKSTGADSTAEFVVENDSQRYAIGVNGSSGDSFEIYNATNNTNVLSVNPTTNNITTSNDLTIGGDVYGDTFVSTTTGLPVTGKFVDGTNTDDAAYMDGNVGINTLAPEATLHVDDRGSTGPAIFVENASDTEGDIAWNAGEHLQLGEWNQTTDTFTERMRIEHTTGNVGIGTTNPDQLLHVAGGVKVNYSTGGMEINTVLNEAANNYVRNSFLMSRDTDLTWDAANDLWVKPNGSNNDFAAILHRNADLSFVAGGSDDLSAGLTNAAFSAAYERLTIKSDTGLVGIGTRLPSEEVHVRKDQTEPTSFYAQNESAAAGANVRAGFGAKSDGTQIDIMAYGTGATGTLSGATRADAAFIRTVTGAPASSLNIGNGGAAPINFFTDDATRMTVLANGNVGIGTTSPVAKLQVGEHLGPPPSSDADELLLTTSGNTGMTIVGGTAHQESINFGYPGFGSTTERGRIVYTNNIGTLSLWADGNEWVTIKSDGKVGISDTTPDGTLKLDVEGQVGATEYCDQNGANCILAGALGGGGGTTLTGTSLLSNNAGTAADGVYSGSGAQSIFIGTNAGQANTTGAENTFVGQLAGQSNTIGAQNLFIGKQSGGGTIDGNNNVAIGPRALYNNNSGDHNISIGSDSGGFVRGNRNIFIGANITGDFGNISDSNRLNIGNLIFGTDLDGTGATVSSGNIGIGTDDPSEELHVRKDQAASTTIAVQNASTGAATGTRAAFTAQSNGAAMDMMVYGTAATGNLGAHPRADTAFVRTHSGSAVSNMVVGNGGAAPLNFITSDATRMTIGTTGNVGIGVSPFSGYKLDIAGGIQLTGNHQGTNLIQFNSTLSGDQWMLYPEAAAFSIINGTTGARSLFLANNGNVGVGKINPDTKLHVEATGESVATFDIKSASADTVLTLDSSDGIISTGSHFLKATDGATEVFSVRGDGNLGIGQAATGNPLDVNGNAMVQGRMAITDTAALSSARTLDIDRTSTGGSAQYGIDAYTRYNGTQTANRTHYGTYSRIALDGSKGAFTMSGNGVRAEVEVEGTVSPDYARAIYAHVDHNGSGTTAEGRGVEVLVDTAAGTTINTAAGLFINLDNDGTINNNYGIFISDVVEGAQTNAYALWANEGDFILDGDGNGVRGGTNAGSDLFFGEGQDAAVWYDGTDLNIDPNIVGSGQVEVRGDLAFEGDLRRTSGTLRCPTGEVLFGFDNGADSTAGDGSHPGLICGPPPQVYQ